MHGDEYNKINQAVTMFNSLDATIRFCELQEGLLESNAGDPLYVGFIGTSGSVSIPAGMQKELRTFLNDQFRRVRSDCNAAKGRIECPAGTAVGNR